MAFFFGGLDYKDVMVCAVKDGVSKKGVKFVSLTVVDGDGNTNTLSSSDPDNMDTIRSLQQGEKVDLTIVAAGGPQRQYAMIAHGFDSVRRHGVASY